MEKILTQYQYILVLVWLVVVAFIGTRVAQKRTVTVLGEDKQRYSWLFAFLAFLPLIFFAANRTLVFGDTAAYHDAFVSMPDDFSKMQGYLDKYVTKDYAFSIFSIVIKCFITKDYIIYFFILALIQGIGLVSIYRKYSEDFVFSIALFVLSTDYVSWMQNGIRQFTAVTIIFATTTLMLRKKYIPLILIIYFASFFHRSAIIMIPLVIALQGKAWNKRTLIVIGLSILAITFVGQFTSFVDFSMQDTQYSNVVTDYTNAGDNGTNILRVLVYAIPTIIAFIGRKEIIKADDKLIHFCTNASLISTGLYALSMFTSGIFFGRMPIYLSLYNYILLPWEIKHIIPEHLRKPIVMIMFVLYFVFYYYQISLTWALF